ncbi:MAG: hypothetical protein RIS70_3459 [Planctomycetota bacterium]|jgi:hypothetical protein
MNRLIGLGKTSLLLVACGLLLVAGAASDEPPARSANPDDMSSPSADRHAMPVESAREQAKLLHTVYAATLDVMHERYFHSERAPVPARAMEDVFAQLARERHIEARWIGVNARTMSLPHEPKDDFERSAAEALRSGKREHESVDGGFYRRAAPIPLGAGCLVCHGNFGMETKSPRFAGLVIKVPVKEQND